MLPGKYILLHQTPYIYANVDLIVSAFMSVYPLTWI